MLDPEAEVDMGLIQATVLCVQFGAFSKSQVYRQLAERQLLQLPSVGGRLKLVHHPPRKAPI